MRVDVMLSAGGVEPVRAAGDLRMLSHAARLGRAAGIVLMSLACAAAMVPVPIVHLVGIPLILVVGMAVAVRVYRSVARLSPMRLACPRCGASNSLGGGWGLRTTTAPLERDCESCRRVLQLSFCPVPGDGETALPTIA